jgi:hypothetical protein
MIRGDEYMTADKVFAILENNLDKIKKAQAEFQTPTGKLRVYKPFFTSLNALLSSESTIEITNGSTFYKDTPLPQRYMGRLEVRLGDNEKGGWKGKQAI